ncbi:MAG: hypothetical protein QOJ79_97 [Actinomycetota bacterium]|jgi:hypothetical protein|nr:hypothetical protein [Actinomycetota bacterium]
MKRALVLVLLVAACGGSSGGGSGDPKAAYLSKAEAICAKANTQIADAKKSPPAGIADVPPYVHKLLDLAKQTLDDLSLLSPPSGDVAEVKAKLLDPLGQQFADGQSFAAKVDAAAAKNDSQTLSQLVFNPPTKTRVDIAWMKSYGFKDCVTTTDTGAAAK